MKSFDSLSKFIDKMADNIDKKVIKAQQKTALEIQKDIINFAEPIGGTGAYKDSIKVYETEIKDNNISTFIGSDMTVGPTKWGPKNDPWLSGAYSNNAPAGTKYNLGYLLEHGTSEHAIPNAFNLGFYWSFTSKNGKFHKGTLEPDFHPGTVAQPHYFLALEKNKKLYKDNIKEAWR